MPDTPAEVIAEVQIDAASAAASEVAGATLVVASEVAAVDQHLAEHQEISEERHEEILGDTEWLRNQLELLLTNHQSVVSSLAAMQAQMTAEFQTLRSQLESLSLSTALSPSNPPASTPEPVAEPVAVVAAVVDQPVAPIDELRKKTRKVI